MLWQESSICGAYIPPRRWVSYWQELSLSRRGRRLGGPQSLCKQGCVADGKNSCCHLLRASFVLAIFYPIANTKSESSYFRANMSVATAKRRLRVAGIQRALGPLARFLVTSCRATRSNIKKVNRSARAEARSMIVRLRSHKSYPKTTPNPLNFLSTFLRNTLAKISSL